jgi:peptidoglycan/LPS O-acetylase OafA/YrhL
VDAGSRSIADVFDDKENNFNLIRMIAALAVLVSHCYPLSGINDFDPLSYFGDYDTAGGWGVSVFFVISGFLVTRSVMRHSSLDYFSSRVLRIIPALALVTTIEVCVIGPLFTQLSLSQYLSSPATWLHFENVSIFSMHYSLPGLFMNNPAKATNGSLWTLPVECGFYVLLPIAAVFGLLRRQFLILATTAIAVVLGFLISTHHLDWVHQGGLLFRQAPLYSTLKNLLFFLSGACFWVFRDKIAYSHGLAAAMVGMLYIFADQPLRLAALYVALPYLVIYAALGKTSVLSWYRRVGDYSYGTYVFAYPVQQSVVTFFGPGIGPVLLGPSRRRLS